MKVLLTRQKEKNKSIIHSLIAMGIDYVETPLLEIKSMDNTTFYENFHIYNADIVIFISANAVKFASDALASANKTWSTQPQYFAVGLATLKACQQQNIPAQSAPEENQQSEGLLSILKSHSVANKNIAIIRGNGGREWLAQQLTKAGANLAYFEVYQRLCPKLNAKNTINFWQKQKIDTILFNSMSQFDNLMSLLVNTQVNTELFSWLRTCHIIVPSMRCKQYVSTFGFDHITNANGATDNAMLAALNI